jgi:carboxymethylenebutenolidase
MREEVVRVARPDREIDTYVAFPDEAGRRPAVLVLHEIFGPDAHIRDVARRFARLGYVAAAPNLFAGPLQALLTPSNVALAMPAFAQAPPDLRRDPAKFAAFAASQPADRRPIIEAFARVSRPDVQAGFAQDLLAVASAVRALPEVQPDRVGAVGFCFGGAMTGWLATQDPRLRAAVIFYGQNPPADRVPQIRAAVLGLYGGEDVGITQKVPELSAAAQAAGVPFRYVVYPGARHAFFNDTRPSNFHATSAAAAWGEVQRFFAAHL